MTQTKKIIELLQAARKNMTDALYEDCIGNANALSLEEFEKVSDADDMIRGIIFKLLDKEGEF